MIYAVAGLIFGIVVGVPAMEGDYDNTVFLSGFLVNMALAVFFCYAGILMDIDFYLVVILVLGMRIFNNLAIIRRLYLKK